MLKLKTILFTCLFLLTFSSLIAQSYKYVYYFDKDLNSCPKAKSIITAKGYTHDGLLQVDYFSNTTGVLLLAVNYTDSSLSVQQGLFRSYYDNAVLEKEGNYDNGMMQGLWQHWDEKGLKTDSMIYEKDYKIRYAAFTHYHKDKHLLSSYAFTDSLQNTFVEKYISDKGIVSSEVNFYGQKGLLKTYDSIGVQLSSDSVFTREEIEAEFPGGTYGWNTFLKKNLNGDVPTDHGAPSGTYTVVVRFVVNKDGTLSNIHTETTNKYGIDKEAMRIIQISPKWIPAKQFGRLVNAYRRQPITFLVQSQ